MMEIIDIENIENSLNGVLSQLGWTKESLFSEPPKVQCPLNPGHMVQESSLKKHLELCSWVKDGYTREDMEAVPPSSDFFYEKAASVTPVTIDKELLSKILSEAFSNGHDSKSFPGVSEKTDSKHLKNVPKTMDRYTVEFTSQERCAIYDYVVSKGKESNKAKELTVNDLLFEFESRDEKDNKPKSHLEILAEQRDYKRRRPTYRAKNVHITKKSYTEILREVIESQSGFLAETLKQEKSSSNERKSSGDLVDDKEKAVRDTDSGCKSSKHSSREKTSRSSHDKSHRKHKRSRSRSRERHSDSHKHKSHHKDKKHKKHN